MLYEPSTAWKLSYVLVYKSKVEDLIFREKVSIIQYISSNFLMLKLKH